MKNLQSLFLCLALSVLVATVTLQSTTSSATSQTQPSATSKEDAYRLNNIGVALLEQFKYKEGADAFRQALKVEPKLSLAQINLSIALFNLPIYLLPLAALAATNLADAPKPGFI